MSANTDIIEQCKELLNAYKLGLLGDTAMPEESHPEFPDQESKLVYFTLPMSLNYQRDSYKLWESALKTFNDPTTSDVFNIQLVANMPTEILREKLLKHKLALQPNKHIQTWKTISQTIFNNWETLVTLFRITNNDFLILRETLQMEYKKGFPYLSGPKIFNYWSFIISEYGGIPLKNKEYIEIAPDTHITKCSVLLGVINEDEKQTISRDEISRRWRNILKDSGISPIGMHPPFWFWSRNNFTYKLKN